MINHIRTLLMNRVADTAFQEPGEEFIDPAFLPLTESGEIIRYRNTLFGATPDRVMLNYRLRQLMPLLHETDLLEFVLEKDKRITYNFDNKPFFDPSIFETRVLQTNGSSKSIRLMGPPMFPDSSGTMKKLWIVTVKAGSTVDVSQQQVHPIVVNNYPYTITDGLSSHVPVPSSPSNYFIFDQPSVGDQWFVTKYSRPTAALGTLLQVARNVEEPSRVELFGLTSPRGRSEPFKTFHNLFVDHHETAYALGGLLLALAYRFEL